MQEVYTWRVSYEIPEDLRKETRFVCVVTKEDNKDAATRAAVKRIRETKEADKYKNFTLGEIEALDVAYMDIN